MGSRLPMEEEARRMAMQGQAPGMAPGMAPMGQPPMPPVPPSQPGPATQLAAAGAKGSDALMPMTPDPAAPADPNKDRRLLLAQFIRQQMGSQSSGLDLAIADRLRRQRQGGSF